MTRRQNAAGPQIRNVIAMAAALRDHLTQAEVDVVRRMFSEHFDRMFDLLAVRGGEALEPDEFAKFVLQTAHQVATEKGVLS